MNVSIRRLRSRVFRPAGLFTMDMLMGLALLVALATVLATTSNRASRATATLAAQRQALHRAEIVLTTLQQGGVVQPSDDLTITTLDVNDAVKVPRGMHWVRIDVRIDQAKHVELAGLTPIGGRS